MVRLGSIFVVLLLAAAKQIDALICSRYPAYTNMTKSLVDENFMIIIAGNPQTYSLGQRYNVSIQAFNGRRFIGFKLGLENDNGDPSANQELGSFEILDPLSTRHGLDCSNMVESINTAPKTRIDITWVAPESSGSGCVLIRTMLLQHRDVWFMDDGGLTRRICEENTDEVESTPSGTDAYSCCACDEARYELTFEGTWSRNLHPKDFPEKGWITRFSDIVGASHTTDYRFWESGKMASEALQEFAEHGSALKLEREFSFNFKSGKIRTIVKARGLAYPNLNGISYASIRADPQHHFLSLASKIDPSPDWIVGVSGVELCLPNCTWLEEKTITLYPWDIGTDAGPSYTSPDQPQLPTDVVRRIRSDFPNDPRSPFYDENGADMYPLAKLNIRRQRIYVRLCENEESNNLNVPRECYTHPWTAWSDCTVNCGKGIQFRTRVYKQPEVASIFNCELETHQERACTGGECESEEGRFPKVWGSDRNDEYDFSETRDCQLTSWGAWSPCSRSCGEGNMVRRRQYANPMVAARCQGVNFARLIEYQRCMGRKCVKEVRGGEYGEETEAEQKEKEVPKEDAAEEERAGRRGYANEETVAENQNGEEDEQLNSAKTGLSEKQQYLGRNYYNRMGPVNPMTQTDESDNEDIEEQQNRYDYGKGYNVANEEEDEQFKSASPGLSNKQHNRGRNYYGRVRPINPMAQTAESDDETIEKQQNRYDYGKSHNVAEGDDEQFNYARPGISNKQQNRGRSYYGRIKPIDSMSQIVENDDKNNNEQENNRYDYGKGYNIAGRSKVAMNKMRKDEIITADNDKEFGYRKANRFGYNSRYSTAGRQNSADKEEEEEENDLERLNDFGWTNRRNRRPYSLLDTRKGNEEHINKPPEIPSYCLRALTAIPCLKHKKMRNYWFYNYCEDKCMIFAADSCDRNYNKFVTLKQCEEICRPPGNEELLKKKQRHDCLKSGERLVPVHRVYSTH